jgi:hypothetical protein
MRRHILALAIALGSVAAVACGDSRLTGPTIGRGTSAPPPVDTSSDTSAFATRTVGAAVVFGSRLNANRS